MSLPPGSTKMREEEFQALCDRLNNDRLTEHDKNVIIGVFKAMRWMTLQLEAGKLGIKRLRALIFGPKTESKKNLIKNAENKAKASTCGSTDGGPGSNPKPGHGRRPVDAYTGANHIFCSHPSHKVGDPCPACGRGKLHGSIDNGRFVQFRGNAPFSATIYETEKLRCGTCGKVFEAPLPQGVSPFRWEESSKTAAAILRYGYGVPHYRLERMQTDLGVPISDSQLFDLSNEVADCGHSPYRYLYKMAAQGTLVHADDTSCRILDLIQENKKTERERTGIFTTAMLSYVEGHQIALFQSGRNHFGENLVDLFEKRKSGTDPPKLMVDGADRNIPASLKVVLGNCLTHGRRQFIGLVESFPQEIEHVIDLLAQVYHRDEMTKQMNLSDEERLQYHQENSDPVMEELKNWCRDQIDSKKVEPNSSLGKAINYMLKRWDKLTMFLHRPGWPLANDIVERLIKSCVLHRKNSLFYKTQHGAVVGDILMTLIHSCVKAGENPFDYLTQLQLHRRQAFQSPQHWLPWNYRDTLRTFQMLTKN